MTASWRHGTLRHGETHDSPLIVKLGGSLLSATEWPRSVAALLASLPAPRLIVTGGGPLVDGLRCIDDARPLPPELVHRLAIACMGHTARIVSAALNVPLVRQIADTGGPTAVLDCPAWLERDDHLAALPVGWHVTSDSIAATVATACGGGLVLVKSVMPAHDDITRLAAAGWVDEWFPTAARPLAHIAWAAPG